MAAPLYGWGQNTAGQLGNGGTADVTVPTELTGRNWVWVSRSKSGTASVGIAEDGGLYVWGTCTKVGALGVPDVTSVATPTLIDPGPWKKAVYAKNHGIGVKEDGTLWGWGHPYMGALGIGTGDVPAIATPFMMDPGLWIDVAVIDYSTYDRVSLAVKADGTLWSCGYGAGTGQGSATTAYGTLTQIPNQANVMAVDAAYGPVAGALKTSGDMLGWGKGTNGHRGAGSQASSPSPVAVPGTWADFALSETHVLALNASGEVWGWGGNQYGQLGLGSTGSLVLPSVVPIAGTFVSIAAGAGSSIIIRDDGAMFSAGYDGVGQLGNGGANTNTSSFAQIGAANAPWRMASSGLSSYAIQFVAAPPSLPTVESSASVGSMLGYPSAVSTSVPAAFAASGRILSDPVVRAAMGGLAVGAAPSVLADAGAMAENPIVHVLGVSNTAYDVPVAVAGVTPEGACTTQYGPVMAAYDVTVTVDSVEPSTRGGTPIAWELVTQLGGTVHHVYGACTTEYGEPSAGHPQIAEVAGVMLTNYGTPSSAASVTPLGVCATMVGEPSAAAAVSVIGACGTKYGVPSNVIAHIVLGVCNTKYGKVKAVRPSSHLVYSLNNGRRAGVPRAAEIA